MSTYHEKVLTFDKGRKKVWKAIIEDISPGKYDSVLEIGAGYCDYINNVNAKLKYALDLSDIIEKYAKKEVHTLVQDLHHEISIENNSLDIIFASNILEHFSVDELKEILPRLYTKLKKGGKLIVMQPNFTYCYKQYFDDFTHKSIWTHVSLKEFLETHKFQINTTKPKYLPHSMKSILPKTYILTKLYLLLPFKVFPGQMLIIGVKNE